MSSAPTASTPDTSGQAPPPERTPVPPAEGAPPTHQQDERGTKPVPHNFVDPTRLGPLNTSSASMMYRTTTSNYGSVPPTEFEMPLEWHGRSQNFTRAQNGIMFKNTALNTTLDRGRFVDVP
eukprot:gnl/Chilomastix_cuspidata/2627.p2 GENE.gnl/Chilomastix_cuspidata/2627~~gnl/Chilomastix_cuspidata/2627.p2  ORF type:complete len:122 (+),score=25.63 gnl/Chilomastix_cuspidata/2627:148-513(+)